MMNAALVFCTCLFVQVGLADMASPYHLREIQEQWTQAGEAECAGLTMRFYVPESDQEKDATVYQIGDEIVAYSVFVELLKPQYFAVKENNGWHVLHHPSLQEHQKQLSLLFQRLDTSAYACVEEFLAAYAL